MDKQDCLKASILDLKSGFLNSVGKLWAKLKITQQKTATQMSGCNFLI